MLDVRRMKVLREVAARGSFSAAAEALSFTQSAVSQQVAALERETGAKLVERGTRGIKLTDAGEALVAHADIVLARLDDAEQELAAIAGLQGGRLRLATFQSAGATLVPRAMGVFHERHPKVELKMIEAEPEDSIPRMKDGEIDIALTYDYEAIPEPADQELERVHLVEDRMDLVIPADHPLAKRKRPKLADFADEPWIMSYLGSTCQQTMVLACRSAGFEPRIAFETDENTAVQAFVAAGMGVALMPRLALTAVNPGTVVREVTPSSQRRIWATRLVEGYRSPASEAMVQILQDVAEEFRETAALAAVS